MTDLTDRQKKLLRVIVERYVDTASPVGSEVIEREFGLGVSPATIRNEMVALSKMGYLKKPHVSAGRVPTTAGLKFYINELMREKSLSIKDEVLLRERLWRDRFEFEKLMGEAVRALAEKTKTLAVLTTTAGEVYYSGMANMLDTPEFYDIDVTQTVLSMLDEAKRIHQLFRRAVGEGPVYVLLGEELGEEYLEPCGVVFTRFDAGPRNTGTVGILGSARLDYPTVIPIIRYFGELLSEIGKSW